VRKIIAGQNGPNAAKLVVRYLPVDQLKPDPRNPRVHSPRQVRQIARSIETFGFNVPVLIDEQGKVLAGHGRLMAAQQLALQEVPAVELSHLTEAQARAFMIADNRLTENATWDDKLLAQQFKELAAVDLDFELEVTGFEMAEIDLRIEQLMDEAGGSPDKADDLTEIPDGPPVSRPGDLWLLGPHRVLCASALEPQSYVMLMEGVRAQAVFSDPPYNVPIDGNVSGSGAIRHREFAMGSGEMREAEFANFLHRAFVLFSRNSDQGSLHFICMDWRHLSELLEAGTGVYTELKNVCIWVKDRAGMGSLYRSQHELVFVFKNGRAAHRNNIQLGRFGRDRSNVWRYACAKTQSRGDEGNLLALHPTVKPVAMVADAIMDCTARGGVVLDGFLGSGSTVIAAERTGRRCFGLELDPAYVDTIVRRWQEFTRDHAQHAGKAKTFNELAEEVEEGKK
jgi:DNA modification methylase